MHDLGEGELRSPLPSEQEQIARLLDHAFGHGAESELLDALRAGGWLLMEQVLASAGEVLGVVALCQLERSPGGQALGALAPLAVAEAARRRGAGSRLVHATIEEARKRGLGGVVVVGDPAFYQRFGFELAPGLLCLWSGPFLQAIELIPGALSGQIELDYPPPFEG